MKISIVGSGNVADAIVGAIAGNPAASGCAEIVQVCARNRAEGPRLAAEAGAEYVSRPGLLTKADLYLIAVSDDAIAGVASQIDAGPGAVIAHTAGSIGMDVLPAGSHRAVFYPLQTFTKGRRADTLHVPVFIEYSSPRAEEALRELAELFSGEVHRADSKTRAWLHLAAVFAGNFTNHMYALAGDILKEHSLPFAVLEPLIREIAAKAIETGAPADVQTGPAQRGDTVTQNRHLAMLSDGSHDREKEIYEIISRSIWQISKKR